MHVDVGIDFSIKVGGGDVHLVDQPCFVCCNSKYNLDAGHLGNQGEGLGVVHPLLLGEPLCYKLCFIADNLASRAGLDLVDLLNANQSFQLVDDIL